MYEEEIEVKTTNDTERPKNGDKIEVDTDVTPIEVKWYYDDDHDGQPDDPANPIGVGKEYIVVCPDSEDPTHDDTGHTIIGVIKQDKKENGENYPDDEKPTQITEPIKVKGNIPGYKPLDPEVEKRILYLNRISAHKRDKTPMPKDFNRDYTVVCFGQC